MNTKKPTGLIRRERVVPKSPEDLSEVKVNKEIKQKGSKSKFDNQKANLKVSQKTKQELDLLMNLTQNKFTYEMVESMIDSYVKNELSTDQQRAFKTLSNLIK
ncbi:hypothetical protein [Apilactobacillus xinyiensis]|uniref:hypothetical protein n=1 Tax=Apilactobacillus xinyiensis TaxID=2841032 RepID=UPI00200CDE0A|nr:hypothetical protein [Apilactobacillus xinyiensis]MCL0319402.1 hypothetical protein [Apilactobacillus xinyiensis]